MKMSLLTLFVRTIFMTNGNKSSLAKGNLNLVKNIDPRSVSGMTITTNQLVPMVTKEFAKLPKK